MKPTVVATTMAKRGFFAPALPHRLARQLTSMRTWGFGLAGELRQAAARSPKSVAVVDDDRRLTYAELVAESDAVTSVLSARGIGPGDRIGLLARNHVGTVSAILGANALGADLVLLNTGLGGDALAHLVTEQDLQLLVHDDEFASLVGDLGVGRLSEGDLAAQVRLLGPVPGPPPPVEAGRTVILTSGTTGMPRAATRRTPGGLGPMVSMLDRIPLNNRDRVLVSAPLFHTWGYAALQLGLGVRATLVLQRRFDPVAAHTALVRYRCHAMFAVPILIERMLAAADAGDLPRPPELRVVAVSGSSLSTGFAPRFMDRYGEVLYSLYGSTEASWICIADPRQLRRDPATAGTPPLGTRVEILDADLAPVRDGVTGRIFVGNDLVFEGYSDGGGVTSHEGMIATGDLGHRAGGLFYVDGRGDDMVVSGGENVHPAAVQRIIEESPEVREVCVTGVPDAEFGQRLAAFVVLEEEASLSGDDVRALVRSRLARHAVPRDVHFVEALPRNAAGKVLARELVVPDA